MFANTVQPTIVSLFSSTSTDPLSLFSKQQDPSLTEDSFIHFLNDASSLPPPTPPAVLCSIPAVDSVHDESNYGYGLHQTVLHIQSPTLRTTFIQCPPDAGRTGTDLGLKHKWLHLQVRNMAREWSFEIGIVDKSAKRGVIRCSTFQVHLISSESIVFDRNTSVPERTQYYTIICSEYAASPSSASFVSAAFIATFDSMVYNCS